MLVEMSRTTRMMERRFVLRDSAQASDRLISALLWLSEMDPALTIPFQLDRTMLSLLIGVQPETVSRLLSQYKTAHLLSYAKGHIVINDRKRLENMLTVRIHDTLPLD